MIDIAAIVLPQPDSPTTPSVSPASTSKLRPSTAWTVPLRRRIRVSRPIHLEQSRHRRYRSCSRTSNASWSASPMKLKATTVITMIASAGYTSHQ